MSKTSLNRQSIRYFASSICSHKYSKQTSGVTAGSLFLLVGDTAPNPLMNAPKAFMQSMTLPLEENCSICVCSSDLYTWKAE